LVVSPRSGGGLRQPAGTAVQRTDRRWSSMINTNAMARRVTVANAVVSLIPSERSSCGTDDDVWMARMMERLGDVAHAYRTGNQDVVDEALKLAATVHGFIDMTGEGRAR